MNDPKYENLTIDDVTNGLSRRRFLQGLACGSLLVMGSSKLAQAAFLGLTQPKTIFLEHQHTGDKLKLTYFEEGSYVPGALREISHFLRDYHNNQVHAIDPKLLDQLHDVKLLLGTNKPFHILSGYRSPSTNANLRRHQSGVANHSLHMEGKAVDIRVEGFTTRTIREAALKVQRGGIGYYPRESFVHLDTGEIRTWHR